jgi:hypothetical protein
MNHVECKRTNKSQKCPKCGWMIQSSTDATYVEFYSHAMGHMHRTKYHKECADIVKAEKEKED